MVGLNRVRTVLSVSTLVVTLVGIVFLLLSQRDPDQLVEVDSGVSVSGPEKTGSDTEVESAPGVDPETQSYGSVEQILKVDFTIPMRTSEADIDPLVEELLRTETIDLYPKLMVLVDSGNAIAAYNTYGFLGNCERLPNDDASFEAAVVRMYETRLPPSTSEGNVPDPRINVENVEASVRHTYAQCKGVPDGAIAERDKMLKIAAEGGVSMAMVDFITANKSTNPDQSAIFAKSLWEQGSANGAAFLAELYGSGWDGQESDPIQAAAYGFISTQTSIEVLQNIENPFDEAHLAGVIQEIRETQNEYLYSLGVNDHARALDLARALVSENSNCCF